MNDELIQRAEKLFTERKEVINLYVDQINKRESEVTTSSNKKEVTRLQNILTNIRENKKETLKIVKNISKHMGNTIYG